MSSSLRLGVPAVDVSHCFWFEWCCVAEGQDFEMFWTDSVSFRFVLFIGFVYFIPLREVHTLWYTPWPRHGGGGLEEKGCLSQRQI